MTTKLPERLCVRVDPLIDNEANYYVIRASLLESETSFGSKLMSITPDTLKSMTGVQIVEHIHRLAKGLMETAQTKDDCIPALTEVSLNITFPIMVKSFLRLVRYTHINICAKG